MKKLTLEELAEKINGRFWEKGDKKRVYLNAGHNTKKMKTTVYVELSPSGMFDVKCYIDCPSQDLNWVISQQEEVIESIERKIDEACADTYYYVEENGVIIDDCSRETELKDLYVDGGLYIREGQAVYFIREEDLEGCEIKSISREDFDKLEETIIPKEKVNKEEKLISSNPFPLPVKVKKTTKLRTKLTSFEIGKTYSHSKFGDGVLISQEEDKAVFNFSNFGERALLKKFANLTLVD